MTCGWCLALTALKAHGAETIITVTEFSVQKDNCDNLEAAIVVSSVPHGLLAI